MKQKVSTSAIESVLQGDASKPEAPMRLVYRIQLNKNFPFSEAEKCLPYLKSLGVSHVYLSPIMKAVSGSNHCYDVTDFGEVNPELGGEDAFRKFSSSCSALGLSILLDIVPNHMAYSLENPYVEAAFIDGTRKFRKIFDTFRNPFSPGDDVIFPFLSGNAASMVSQHMVRISPGLIPVLHIDTMDIPLRKMPAIPADDVPGENRKNQVEAEDDAVSDIEIRNIHVFEDIINDLPLRPVFWEYSSRRINYRRFFAVNGLIAIRSHDMNIIKLTHRKITELARNTCVRGVRIDHLDGLYDPAGYVKFLRKALPGKIILAEKVLIPGETLPESLEIDGTTGYDFLGMINALYSNPDGYRALNEEFRFEVHGYDDIHEVLLKYKREFIRDEFSGDVDNLSWPIYDALVLKHAYEYSYSEIRAAVEHILASFENYRTYSTEGDAGEIARHLAEVSGGGINSIQYILSDHVSRGCRHCTGPILRLQQYSGALMAKNLEDRLFFSFNPLIFMNEVGWSPTAAIPDWHEFLEFIRKRSGLPLSINDGSTHDTKFGEDLRNSGLVISEYHDLFFRILSDLQSRPATGAFAGNLAVEHIYYISQLILASYGSASSYTDYRKEIGIQLVKAMRESMISTSWKNPDVEYEKAAMNYAELIIGLLDSGNWDAGLEMAEKCRDIGHYNSISMLVLRFMLPGIPALYQGSEYINVHFTDPDNREKVNFVSLQHNFGKLASISLNTAGIPPFPSLKSKMVSVLSAIRGELAEVLGNGTPEALHVTGSHSSCILPYYMMHGSEVVIVVVLRKFSEIVTEKNVLDTGKLHDDIITVPDVIAGKYTELLSGRIVTISGELRPANIMEEIPAAVLRKVE